MFKNVYDSFAHWYHDQKGTIYIYSDPHFADEETKVLRTFNPTDEEQIKRINKVVGKYDTLIILGDIGDERLVAQLNGYKVLVMGNHDRGATNYTRKRYVYNIDPLESSFETAMDTIRKAYPAYWTVRGTRKPDEYIIEVDNNLFDEVYEGALLIAPNLILSHEPVNFPYALNIHGHTHRHAPADGMHLNVCAEHINYTPIQLSSIVKSGTLKHIPDIHREAIDTQKSRKSIK